MKRITLICIIMTALYLLLIMMASAQSNNAIKNDKIIFLDGIVKEGTITALTNDKVKFIHCDETLGYEFNKNEIEKIEFASGRTESVTAKKIMVHADPVNTRNRVAVLPMKYVADGNADKIDYMRSFLQEITISFMAKSAAELKFLDAADVNAMLLKNEINDSNIAQYTPTDLAKMLQVEYVIVGSVMQDRGKLVTHVNNNNNRRETIKRDGNEVKIRGNNNSHGTETTTQEIETNVTLAIYSETGQKIYGNSRQSILSDADAYKFAIRYLLRRTPLYKR
ncbi:MAG: hypothetical protein QM737_15615 [Ferruginibacter sp.]